MRINWRNLSKASREVTVPRQNRGTQNSVSSEKIRKRGQKWSSNGDNNNNDSNNNNNNKLLFCINHFIAAHCFLLIDHLVISLSIEIFLIFQAHGSVLHTPWLVMALVNTNPCNLFMISSSHIFLWSHSLDSYFPVFHLGPGYNKPLITQGTTICWFCSVFLVPHPLCFPSLIKQLKPLPYYYKHWYTPKFCLLFFNFILISWQKPTQVNVIFYLLSTCLLWLNVTRRKCIIMLTSF